MNDVNININPNALRNNMKKFIIDNGIIGTAAGVCIALATKDVVQSFVNDIIMPSIYLILVTMNASYFSKTLSSKHSVDFPHFINQFVSWIFITIITFLFVKIAFGSLFGTNEDSPNTHDKTATTAAIAVSVSSNK
jgi:large-conductance mechanosensitive channel